MGSTSRAIFAGVGAGLQTFGAGLAQKYHQDQANIRIDERLKTEDAFKKRELDIKEQDANNRKAAAARQARFDNMKLMHLNLTRGLAGAGDNVNEQASVISKYFPDKRQYSNNPSMAATMSGIDGKQPYMVWDVNYNKEDPVTGQLVPNPETGATEQIPSASGPKVFWTKDDYTNFKAKLINPQVFTAFATQDITTDMAIKRDVAVSEAKTKTTAGQAALAKTKSETALNIAKAKTVGKGPDKTSTVQGLDGKTVELTTPDTNKLINDTKSLKEKFIGITSGEAYRFMQGMRDPNMARGLQQAAQKVVNKKALRNDVIKDLMIIYRVTKTTATDILSEAMSGVKDTRPTLWEKFMGRGEGNVAPEEVEDAGGTPETLADQARDFD
jgi:hypothetical protein